MVTNSRQQRRSNKVWRRRQCKACGNVFTTIECPDLASSLLYISATGHLEPFSRDNLFVSVYDSLKHRKRAINDANALTETVISKLSDSVALAQLDRSLVVGTVTDVLKRFDKTAATVYQAYHPLQASK